MTDLENRSVLAAVRGLAAAGFEVGATMAEASAPGARSRRLTQRFVTGAVEGRAAVDAAARVAAEHGYDVLLPGTDAAVFAFSLYRHRLPVGLRHGLPRHELVARAFDRIELARAGQRAGLVTVPFRTCSSDQEVLAAAQEFGFPLFVKPASVVSVVGESLNRQATSRVEGEADLVKASHELGLPVVVQAPVAGPVISVGGALVAGELRGAVVSRYLRTWPAQAGSVAFSTTIAPPDGLLRAVKQVVAEIGWQGIFELELVQRHDGTLAPIDFNPRVYGSMDLAVKAGANLPALWCDSLVGRRSQPEAARVGVSYRWGDADLRHGLWQARRGRLRAAFRCLRPRRVAAHGYFDRADPAPAASRLSELLGTRARPSGGLSPAGRSAPLTPGARTSGTGAPLRATCI